MRYLLLSCVLSLSLLGCGGDNGDGLSGSSSETVTLSGGNTVTEREYQSNISALISDLGYTQVCHTLAPNMEDPLEASSREDRQRIIELHREVCERHAESTR